MYKTFYELDVYINGVENPYGFLDDTNSSNGTAALMQVKAGRDIDAVASFGDVPNNTIIPYHAIEYAVVFPDRQEGPDPVDDNCNIGGVAEPGTLKIVNASDETIQHVYVFISEALDGTYGDLTFSTTPPEGESFPDGYHAWAETRLEPGASVTATGLSDKGRILIYAGPNAYNATVPAVVNISGGIK